MNRWDALTKIVVSFNKAERPWLAFGTVALFVLPIIGVIGAVTALLR